jgi:alkylation response protein AidB-like acyl-CoA dehydrogenase
MEFAKSDIQQMLLDSAERFLGETAGVEYWRGQRHSPDGFDRSRWAAFAELGWLALPVPESAGGLGGTLEDVALLNVTLGRHLATEPYVSTAVLCAHILAAADGERHAELLAAVAEGGQLLALAHAEPGRDALGGEAHEALAIRSGRGFVLNGKKLMALDAPSADRLIVSAELEGEAGLALFLVDREAEGVLIDAYPLIDGARAADVVLCDVALGPEALIAGGNTGAAVLHAATDRACVALMAQAVGSMEACLRICGDYVKERRQFGVAIGSFQAVQHMLSDMFIAAYQARSMLYQAIAGSYGDAAAFSAAVSAARIVVSEAGQVVSRNGIQVHGGYGITDEYEISHHFRRLLAIEKSYGDIDRHVRRLAEATFSESARSAA